MQCQEKVIDREDRWSRQKTCSKAAVIERDGKHYCKIHDPEYVKTKEERCRRKWKIEWEIKDIQGKVRCVEGKIVNHVVCDDVISIKALEIHAENIRALQAEIAELEKKLEG